MLLIADGCEVEKSNPEGLTGLMLAAQRGHAECVAALLGAGADPDATQSSGDTALHLVGTSREGQGERNFIGAKLRQGEVSHLVARTTRHAPTPKPEPQPQPSHHTRALSAPTPTANP